MEIARLVNSNDQEEIEKEIFELVKKDKQWIAEIVKFYAQNVSPDVASIRQLVHDYHNPINLEDKE